MLMRHVVCVVCLAACTLFGMPALQQAVAEQPQAGETVRGVWWIDVSIYRHGQRASQTLGWYSTRENALAAYQRFVNSLEAGANPRLERVYSK